LLLLEKQVLLLHGVGISIATTAAWNARSRWIAGGGGLLRGKTQGRRGTAGGWSRWWSNGGTGPVPLALVIFAHDEWPVPRRSFNTERAAVVVDVLVI
jgi:hypothetical protein